ncbi:MAG TPA: carbon-nitrogen family hydrolase [Limnochordia bacterium]
MRTSVIQFPIRTRAFEENIAVAARWIEEAGRRRSDLIVLPEMWNTGFAFPDLAEWAEAAWEPSISFLRYMAQKQRCVIAGGVAEPVAGGVFNTLVWFGPQGDLLGKYRKIHLFPLMDEDRFLREGDQIEPVLTEHGRLGGIICYDIRFPELARALARQGCWALVVPSQFPAPRLAHWQTLLGARAIENQLWVAAANRTGAEGRLEFFGHSMIIDPWGEIADALEERPGVATADITRERVDEVRESLPAFSRRREDIYARCSGSGEPEGSE